MLTPTDHRLLERQRDYLAKRIYTPLFSVPFHGFFTYDRLTLEQAQSRKKQPLADGLSWGEKWQYAWLFAEITVPEGCEGERLLFTGTTGEALVYVDGQVACALDKQHTHVTLSRAAKVGQTFSVAMEVYAGHAGGRTLENPQVLIPEQYPQEFPESGKNQQTLRNGSCGVMHEEVFGLWMDLLTLYDLRRHLGEDSLRLAQVDAGLRRVCQTVDLELPMPEFKKTVTQARDILAPLLACRNGSTAQRAFAIGNSHLDLEWLWTTAETRRKNARTLSNQLRLIEQYPEYRYIQSQPWLLSHLKQDYPALFSQVKQAVQNGQIIPEGGSWVQMDTNLPGGESLIRQLLVGKAFIREEFGYDSRILWLPDSFGVSGALPQIMKGCGLDYLFSAKLKWQYSEDDAFPQATFHWQGIDGTSVLSHICVGYANQSRPSDVIYKGRINQNKAEVPAFLFPYGWGDGGGGATEIELEYMRRQADLEGMPRTEHCHPIEFFNFVQEQCALTARQTGELYYTEHRGTYTSQARIKRLNRQCETALHEAEFWTAYLGLPHNPTLQELWKEKLFLDFHDILPGSSIRQVCQDAEQHYQNIIDRAQELTASALSQAVTAEDGVLTVFNSLSHARTVTLPLPDGYTSIEGGYTQEVDGVAVAAVKLPPCGYRSFRMGHDPLAPSQPLNEPILENAHIRAVFDDKGRLVSLIDKKSLTEFLDGPSNEFRLYRDHPSWFDAADIEAHYQNGEIALPDATIVPEYTGPVLSGLRITKAFLHSRITQRVTLAKDSPCLTFETTVDWQEEHKLLKVDFHTNIHTQELVSEIQFGHVTRPTHRNTAHDAAQFEVSQHKWSALTESGRGFALLNDCKYGISARQGRMGLTLLKSAASPALHSDKGTHTFTYAVMPFASAFIHSDCIDRAYDLNVPPIVMRGRAEAADWLTLTGDGVILETLKPAQDGSGDRILRLYEAKRTRTEATLEFLQPIRACEQTDMSEQNGQALPLTDNRVKLSLRPFEIVTLRIKR